MIRTTYDMYPGLLLKCRCDIKVPQFVGEGRLDRSLFLSSERPDKLYVTNHVSDYKKRTVRP